VLATFAGDGQEVGPDITKFKGSHFRQSQAGIAEEFDDFGLGFRADF